MNILRYLLFGVLVGRVILFWSLVCYISLGYAALGSYSEQQIQQKQRKQPIYMKENTLQHRIRIIPLKEAMVCYFEILFTDELQMKTWICISFSSLSLFGVVVRYCLAVCYTCLYTLRIIVL